MHFHHDIDDTAEVRNETHWEGFESSVADVVRTVALQRFDDIRDFLGHGRGKLNVCKATLSEIRLWKSARSGGDGLGKHCA